MSKNTKASLHSALIETSWRIVKKFRSIMDNYNERRRIEKIKVFQLIQENLAILGIDRNAAMKTHPFNMKNLIALQAINLNIICTVMYIIVEVNTFFIIMQCIYEFSVNVSVLLIALVILLKLKESYACIDDCDSLVNASKNECSLSWWNWSWWNKNKNFFTILSELKYSASQSIFKEANQRVEKLSNIVFFLMVKITPGVVFLPSFIYSFIIYFAIDSENDPFTLPISFWWAIIIIFYEDVTHFIGINQNLWIVFLW